MTHPRARNRGRLRPSRFLPKPLLWLTLVAIAAAGPGELRADQADDDYRVAITHYKKQRWKLASEAFAQFTKTHKTHRLLPFARLYLGVALENQEKYGEARTVLRAFAKDYPQSRSRPDALYRIAECSYFLTDFKAAETEFQAFLKSTKQHDFFEYALPYLGDAQYQLNKPKEAAATFQRALKDYPKGRMADDATFGLARCQAALNQADKALKLYGELAKRPGSSFASAAQMEIGLLLFRNEKYDQAAAAFDEFVTRFDKLPERFRASLNAGVAYFRAGHLKAALPRFAKAAEDDTFKPAAVYWQGVCHKQLKNYGDAVKLLTAEFQRDSKSKYASRIVWEWAVCEELRGQLDEAGKRYLEFVKLWPKDDNADDALFFAADIAFRQQKPADAQALLARLRKEYPDSALRPYRDLLQARILTSGKNKKDYQSAALLLRNIIATAKEPRPQQLARLHLVRTYRLLNDHKKALEAAAPLIELVSRPNANPELYDVLVLAARSQLEVRNHQKCIDSVTRYFKLRPESDHTALLLATRATAAFHAKDAKQQDADLDRLLKDFQKDEITGRTIHTLAEAAYQKSDWKQAESLFARLAKLGKSSPYHATALSGLGWSQFEQKKFSAASTTFGSLLKDHADDPLLASQAAFQQAECAEKLGQSEDAAKKYKAAFEQFAPKTPAPAGTEKVRQKHYYTFNAGLRAARTFGKLKKIKEADALYEQLLTKFPKVSDLDRRLDEWAALNYNAENFKRADEIFRRLVKETPNSTLADNARYTLAESNLNAGKVDEAKKVFVELHAGKSSDQVVKEVSLYRLISIAVDQENWKEAQAWAVKFQAEFPRSMHRWYAAFSEADARFQQGELDAAKKILLKLQAEKPGSTAAQSAWFPRVWVMTAEIQSRLKDYREVEATVRVGEQRFATWPQVYLLEDVLGRCFKQQARFDDARQAFRRVTSHKTGKNTETAAKCQFLIGDTYVMQDDFKNARKEYYTLDALYDFPEWQSAALYMAGQCEEKLKDYPAAVKTYQDLIKRFPKSRYVTKAKTRLVAARKRAGLQ